MKTKRKGGGPLLPITGSSLKIFLSVFLLLFCNAISMRTSSAAPRPEAYFTDIGQFNYAKFLDREGEYLQAAREYARLIEKFPSSLLMAEAQFKQGMAYFKAGRYHESEEVFILFLDNFKASPFRAMAEEAREKAHKMYLRERLPQVVLKAGPLRGNSPHGVKIRAVQVALFNGRTTGELKGEMQALKDAGVDTVIVRVFQNPGDRFYPFPGGRKVSGVYFNTTHAPVVADLLSRFVTIAHGTGLNIFAWMTTRYADYGIEGRNDLACRGYDIRTGDTFGCRGLDIFNDEVSAHLTALYSDLAEYDIDGILFQDDLVLRHNEGVGPAAAALYRKETGSELNPRNFYLRGADGSVEYTEAFWRWTSWKNKRLLEVAKRLKAAVRRKHPGVKFAINLMYENLTNPPGALAWLSQSLEASVKMGFDYYSVMAYQRQMARELDKSPGYVRAMIERMITTAVKTVGDPERVLIKFQTVDWRTGSNLTDDEIVGLVRGMKGLRGISVAFVPYRGGLPLRRIWKEAFYASFR